MTLIFQIAAGIVVGAFVIFVLALAADLLLD